MSSQGNSNSLVTSSGGAPNVQWQIDIPSLSQLIVNLGASGLKQLAMAGVDVHSVGCILLIANLTPTTIEYRRDLNRIRESQRKERIWLYKVVEIGTATNFLVDQLLKTRAGENVLALLSAILPLLPEEAFADVLLKSFELSGIPADSTPGLGQISRIREALTPFMARTVIKDRILQYHSLFSHLTSSTIGLSNAIPSQNVISEFLSIFHKLATHETPFLLHYHGIDGAAWAAAYACNVLGLQACAIRSNGDVISLNATYENAQVLFYIDSGKNELFLLQKGAIEALISISSMDSMNFLDMPWLISCDSVNWLENFYPDLQASGIGDEISNYVVEKAFSWISEVMNFGFVEIPESSFISYGEYYLHEIQNRQLRILTILGFSTQPREFYVQRHRLSRGLSQSAEQCIEKIPSSLSSVLPNVVNLSVILAFTNWDTTIRALSAVFFDRIWFHRAPSIRLPEFREMGPYGRGNALMTFENTVLKEATAWCTSTNPRTKSELDMFDNNCLARDFNGTVVILNSICEQSLTELKGFLWRLYPGQIIGNGERCKYVKEELRGIPDLIRNPVSFTGTAPTPARIKPTNKLRTITFNQDFTVSGDVIWTSPRVFVNDSVIFGISAKRICHSINRMFISRSCPHPADQSFDMNQLLCGQVFWVEGPYFNLDALAPFIASEVYSHKILILQQVDGNTLGQWLSCALAGQDHNPINLVWQRDSCLQCITNKIPYLTSNVFVIIADTNSKAP